MSLETIEYLQSSFPFFQGIEFLTLCILSISFYTAFLFYQRIRGYENLNPPPPIQYLSPEQTQEELAESIPIQAGILIEAFLEFNILQNEFVCDGHVWFLFSPSLVRLETLGEFSFDKGRILEKDPPETKMIGDKLLASYRTKFRFSSNLDFHAFPVDDHRVHLLLKNEHVSSREIRFETSQTYFQLPVQPLFSEWSIFNKGAESGIDARSFDPHIPHSQFSFPCVLFYIDFCRKGMRRALILTLPIVFIFFVGFTSLIFVHHSDLALILGLNTGSITGLIFYRFVIESLSPNVGYFTITDHIFTLFLIFSFVVFLSATYLVEANLSPFMKNSLHLFAVVSLTLAILVSMYAVVQKYARKRT